MLMTKLLLPASAALFLMLTSCSEPPPATVKKEPEKIEPASGQSALFKMYQTARAAWSADAEVLKMNSIHLPEVPTVPGKAGAWEAAFTSARLGRARSYTYSVIEGQGNLHKGVFGGPEEGWSGPTGITSTFPFIAVKIDTDAAYQTALAHGGADYDKQTPGKTITVLLEKTNKHPDPVWRIVWGESVGTSNFSVLVDATVGDFLEKLH